MVLLVCPSLRSQFTVKNWLLADGYPGNPYAEWSSNFGVAGTVFNITWTTAQTVRVLQQAEFDLA